MLIAQQKLNENVAEYVLYMYQIEDLIRAYQFDLDRIMKEVVAPNLPDSSFLERYRAWYGGLIQDMKSERIMEAGHRLELQDVLVELSYLHNSLLTVVNDEKYKTLYSTALPFVEDFIDRSNLKGMNHLEVCFHALYMKLLMRLQKKEIGQETEEAFDSMRILLAYLTRSYHQMKTGEGQYWNN
ncbi:DUF4924 family protein [Fluviicola taffensis]|uniref:DUF4924 domain-containing protein n=1 Tax=Fluviicola taffensis (strain DSM 16823 / NCIMB 13979 / RW262) TaxID=755732 RepID=F2IGX9_FLUTR|nr:DUF4924 family protein [Fluviicola taffensis]AEA44760.1 hypothetical protein Fluta_2780 [Fluviicola taffensis DSM 16823]